MSSARKLDENGKCAPLLYYKFRLACSRVKFELNNNKVLLARLYLTVKFSTLSVLARKGTRSIK